MKNYAIIGLGNFGFNIAKKLAEYGTKVLAIDINEERVNEIKNYVQDVVIGDAKNKKFLAEFIDKKFDGVIISIGVNMVDSILAVHHLKEIGVTSIAVKAINDVHAELLQVMGATEIISPEKDIADWLAHRITTPNLLEHIPLTSEFSIVEVACPDKFAGKSLKDLQLRSKFGLLIIAIKDVLGNQFLLMPDANQKLKPDTLLLVLGKKENISKLKI